MNWANYTLIGVMILELGIHLAMHGKPKEGDYNFGFSLIITLITMIILYFGGWFA